MVVELITLALWSVLCLFMGYAWATRDSLLCIENVERWINDTNSNNWVDASLYYKIQEDYNELLAEYNQYQGAVKALKDCNKFKQEGD